MMVVNGATIRFRTKCRIELVSQARFLFGKQIMSPDEAETSLRKLYYNLQILYAGAPEDQLEAERRLKVLMEYLHREQQTDAIAAAVAVDECFKTGDYYRALKLLRAMIRDENHQLIVAEPAL